MEFIPSDAETDEFRSGEFIKLSDCPPDFEPLFTNARKAIEKDDVDNLKVAVDAMKAAKFPGENCLDVCEMVLDPRTTDKYYPMTLLAFTGYHARFEMLDILIEEGANVDMGDPFSGTPLLQMMVYAHIKQKQHKLRRIEINIDVVEYFIECEAVLSRIIACGAYDKVTALEMAISFQRFDIAEMLVKAGADPILGGDGTTSPVFIEYVQFGTKTFIKWLLEDFLSSDQIPVFVDRLIDTGVMFRDEMRHIATNTYDKNASHTFLLSGHEEAIRRLVDKRPDLLKEADNFGRTALHLAARDGDIASVTILLDCNASVEAEDKDLMTPLMLAAQNGHEEVVQQIGKFSSRTGASTNPMSLWSWALQYGYTSYFEALHRTAELEEALMSPLDNDNNTIAHIAAAGGNVAVFKSTFPKTHKQPLFEILTKRNEQMKTPLQLAIENGNIGILNALQERRADREKKASMKASKKDLFQQQAESVEKKAWKTFWDKESPGLFHYACVHGTVDIVKYFVTKLVPPTIRYAEDRNHTPLSHAAEAGNHDIVAYLLSITDVSPEGIGKKEVLAAGDKPYSPLMLAAKNGHAKCVSLLLEKRADVEVVSECDYNCLLESIDEGHKDVAIALLSHQETWRKSMRYYLKKEGRTITPMRMLIEQMPGVAKMVFTKCVSNRDANVKVSGPNYITVKQVVYDFEFIEDFSEPRQMKTESIQLMPRASGTTTGHPYGLIQNDDDDQDECKPPLVPPSEYSPLYHPLTLMVNHERLSLLQHPLIYRYINYKWWKLSFPLFLLYILCYGLFLILLTSFTLTLPRPGPTDDFCPANDTLEGYSKLDLEDDDCTDPDAVDRRALTALAIILIFTSIAFLVFEVWFRYVMRERRNFFYYFELFFRAAVFLLTIVFVFGFVNDCWCAPAWQWQIGALAVFMAFFNFILLLKGMPQFGVPINMLLNIVVTFLKLIYLPLLLLLSFAIPFYMVFVRNGAAVLDKDGPGTLTSFSTPANSFAKTIMQTTGELDYGTLFEEANLLYSPMAYILFISFVVLMPILFSNLLIGLAVGTTDEDTERATLTNIQLQVDYIVQLEDSKTLRRWGRLPYLKYTQNIKKHWFWLWRDGFRGVDYKAQAALVEDLYEDTFDSDGDTKEAVQELKEKVSSMAAMMDSLHRTIPALERSHKQLQEALQETLEKMQKEKASHKELEKSLETKMNCLQENMTEILKKLDK